MANGRQRSSNRARAAEDAEAAIKEVTAAIKDGGVDPGPAPTNAWLTYQDVSAALANG